MAEPISYTDVFRHILIASSLDKQLELIKDIEAALAGGVEWCDERIAFLQASENLKRTQVVAMPPAIVEAVVRLGLVCAYQQNETNALHIALWLDDYNCLWELIDAVVQGMAKGTAAPVWEHFLDTAIPTKPINIDKVLKIVRESADKE